MGFDRRQIDDFFFHLPKLSPSRQTRLRVSCQTRQRGLRRDRGARMARSAANGRHRNSFQEIRHWPIL
jgi:hypothetical protein